MERRKFLILGHPRSGTGFMSVLFQRFGYDVRHEVLGNDGISSWMFAVNDYQIFTDTSLNRKDFDFDHVIMVLRHPIDIISSTYYTENGSFDFRNKHVNFAGLTDLEIAVKSVLDWYKIIESQSPVLKIRVDREPELELHQFLTSVENRHMEAPVEKIGRVNARVHPSMEFSVIADQCGYDLVNELKAFCDLYQYSVETFAG